MGAAARRLFQSPRRGEQGNLFGTGLKLSNVWYAHEKTNVRLTRRGPRSSTARA